MTIANNEAVWASKDRRIKVVRVGSIEIKRKDRGRLRYEWVDGYAVVRDGRVQFPWMQKRECIRDAKEQASK